jgi:Sec7-like guanine-nucleotide exchange factor
VFLDCVNGVVSAMLILNSDLYSEHRPHHPLNLHSFMSSLQEIPACADLPEEELRWLYMSIKNEPLPVARVKDSKFVYVRRSG